jgi:hypothetical protein
MLAVDNSHPWWLWPNLLSLDAPAIAVVWQSFLSTSEGVEVPLAATVTLALVVWSIYLIDRWLDARRHRLCGTDRHRFAARNPRTVAGLAFLATPAAGTIAGVGLPFTYLEVGGGVAVLSMGYFTVVHLTHARRSLFRGFKEVSVGAVFAIGVAIPLIVGTTQTSPQWVPGVIAFGALCGLNCILISRWEESASSAPSGWTALAVGAIAVSASVGARFPVSVAILASLGLLVGLDLIRNRISTRGLRVLVDAALLTPLFVAVVA